MDAFFPVERRVRFVLYVTCVTLGNGMKEFVAVFVLLGIFGGGLASKDNLQIRRTRGISLEMKAFYDPLKDFTCIDGTMKLPFGYVNDDYCDCPDGSDEPGTAACPKTKFHCVNLMHAGIDIPSSRVNDGLCDCCDGSDEYSSRVNCPNTCEELGRAAREEAKRREELLTQGAQVRRQMVEGGKQKVEEAKQKLEQLKGEIEEAKKNRDEKDSLRKESEEKERKHLDEETAKNAPIENPGKEGVDKYIEEDRQKAEEAFQELDTNEDSVLTVNEIQEQPIFDQNRDGQVSIDEARFFLAYKEEADLEEFISTAWPLVKPVWLMSKATPIPPALPEEVIPSPTEKEDEEIDDEQDLEEDVDHPTGDDYTDEEVEAHPPEFPKKEEEEDKDRDPVVKAAVEEADKARSEYQEAERKYKDMEQELSQHEAMVNGDFGEESEYASMRGECYELTDREYTYKMCPFDKCSQRPKDGGSETSLGRWARWEPQEGNKYGRMKFEGGTGCWNGPARSTVVLVRCGLENTVTSAYEPSRCEYQFEFSTPAACTTGMPTTEAHRSHEEL